ncbi:MAG: choice-of-anchor B family protein [Bacteroidota bacterium]|nr:choice-of-anchor B family protein [Bacteroidota bacterium]
MVGSKRKAISLILVIILYCTGHTYSQIAHKMKLLGNFNKPDLTVISGNQTWNDLTGYFDPKTQREYVITGTTDSIYFLDITNPANIKQVDVRFGKSIYARNRDYETYKHYAYCVSDQASGIGALQIFDLQYLPDSVHKIYESSSLGIFTHTIHIDSMSARLYMCANTKTPQPFSAMDIISLQNPEQPVFLAKLEVPVKPGGSPLFDLVHEMYVRNDTAYLSCGNEGIFIYDLRNPGKQSIIGSINAYPDKGYNHSCVLDNTGKFIMFTDENAGLDIKIFDINTLSDPKFVSQFNSSPMATPHNAYWHGDLAYVSSYHDGVRVYDIKDKSNPVMVAWYDTHDTIEDYLGYKGCWGVYPYLPGRRVVASDMTYGIFVFEMDSNLVSMPELKVSKIDFRLFPNPFTGKIKLELNQTGMEPIDFKVYNLCGEMLLHSRITEAIFEADLSSLKSGIYFVQLANKNFSQFKKIIKTN